MQKPHPVISNQHKHNDVGTNKQTAMVKNGIIPCYFTCTLKFKLSHPCPL